MFQTNNKYIVKKLIKRSMKANRLRNIFIITAVALTAFLISSVFSIGMSFIETYQLQKIRTMGTMAHGALTKPTREQVESLKSLDYIDTVGLQTSVATVVNTPEMGNVVLGLNWFDKNEWEGLKKPAINNVTGSYPEEYNEIMVATWILERMGITEPEIGMELVIPYRLLNGDASIKTEKFILSGYYTEYMNIRTGNAGVILVSETFAGSAGLSPELTGAASFKFKSNSGIGTQFDKVLRDITISANQKLKMAPIYENSIGDNIAALAGVACIVVFLMLSGYLLIYNVLYISVSKDVRFFGLLKTIGTTSGQIRKLVMGQMWRMSIAGIPVGLFVGTLASFIFVPMAMSATDTETGVKISFSPIIYIGAAVFALLTTFVSSIKPARKAGEISPIEAVRYTGVTVKGSIKKGTGGGKLHKMALRNIFREKKRALVVFISLFLGMTTFLIVNTLVLSMDTDNYLKSYFENDFTLKNNTLSIYSSEAKQKFDQSFISDIKKLEGVEKLRTTTVNEITIKYEQRKYEEHLKNFAERYKTELPTEEQFEQNPQFFWSNLVGMDVEYVEELNKKLDSPIDIQAFKKGDIALISTDNPELYDLNSDISFYLEDKNELLTIKLGGFLPARTSFDGGGGMAPNIFISNSKMKELVEDPLVYSLTFDSEDKVEAAILETLKEKVKSDNEISVESKLDILEQFKSSKTMLHILGTGMSIVLALIGILNFVNVMLTGVNVRKREFAVIESIGMTSRQLKKMLLYEGLAYAVISCVLIGVIGNILSYGIFTLFQKEADYAIFTFPAIPFVLSILTIFAVCFVVPLIAYRWTKGQSVIQRLRYAEV